MLQQVVTYSKFTEIYVGEDFQKIPRDQAQETLPCRELNVNTKDKTS